MLGDLKDLSDRLTTLPEELKGTAGVCQLKKVSCRCMAWSVSISGPRGHATGFGNVALPAIGCPRFEQPAQLALWGPDGYLAGEAVLLGNPHKGGQWVRCEFWLRDMWEFITPLELSDLLDEQSPTYREVFAVPEDFAD